FPPPPTPTPLPYTTLFRSEAHDLDPPELAKPLLERLRARQRPIREHELARRALEERRQDAARRAAGAEHEHSPVFERPAEILGRSEEHTSELQSRENLVCR